MSELVPGLLLFSAVMFVASIAVPLVDWLFEEKK